MPPSTVVVSGFGAFGNHKTNPSAAVAKALSTYPIEDCIVYSHEMRVLYSEVKEVIPKLWMEYNPDLVIHLGVHPEHNSIRIESTAYANGYCRLDINGCVPLDNKCVHNMDHSLRTSIDVEGLVEKTKEKLKGEIGELSIQSSDDPGRYLCGFSYYLSLCNDNSKVLFIHIPPLNEEVTVQLLTRVVAIIITNTLKHF